jgi:hypothetical protein
VKAATENLIAAWFQFDVDGPGSRLDFDLQDIGGPPERLFQFHRLDRATSLQLLLNEVPRLK